MEKKRFFPHINALRFVAILLTVSGHWAMASGITQHTLFMGQYGVDLFFTISGFLITLHFLESAQQNSLTRKKILSYFFFNRALRIFPPYFLLLLLLWMIHLIFNITTWMPGTGIYYFTYTSNLLFYFQGLPPVSYLNHTWSLGVEEQFYLIWPLFSIVLFPKHVKYLAFAFIVIGITTHLIHSPFYGERYACYVNWLPFANYHTLGTGALLAYCVSRKPIKNKNLNTLLHPALWISIFVISHFSKSSMHSGKVWIFFQETALCVTTMSLVHSGWKGFRGWAGQLCNNRGIQYIGLISYGIYLYESPLTFLLLNTLTKYNVLLPGGPVLKIFAFALLTITAAHYSYQFLESRFLRLKKKYY